jgi:hypothetical protein
MQNVLNVVHQLIKTILIGLALQGNSYLPRPLTLEEIENAFKDTPLGPL